MNPIKLSPASLKLLANWKRNDKRFFRKYSKNAETMKVIAALAELIATYEIRAQEPTPFYC